MFGRKMSAFEKRSCLISCLPSVPNPFNTQNYNNKAAKYHVEVEDVIEWGFNYQAVLNSTEFSEENINFYEACLEYDSINDEEKKFLKAKQIYEEYISGESSTEISLPSDIRDAVEVSMIDPNADTFKQAFSHIYDLMKRDSYPRFKTSDIYREYLEKTKTVDSLTD